ncbi:phosphopantetheine-binding protein, partial [Serratia rubidaea]|uniref:phosphopantetheine-binding protein n=1 Tax=Serratia rubidaea TaxID=61652 RepID=UPI0019B8A58C
ADPFVEGGRLYRTGDLAYWQENGEAAFVGRNDFQVKVQGFRIELTEIEAALARQPGVKEAVVLAHEGASGEKVLAAYYTGEAQESTALHGQLSRQLPAYMVPAAYEHLAALPLTAIGKLDRAALPSPAEARPATAAPEGDIERQLAQLWQELLPNVGEVGRHDNFFALGGHSLLLIALTERMRQCELHVDIQTLFSASTLAELAAQVTQQASDVLVPPNLISQSDDMDFEEFRL